MERVNVKNLADRVRENIARVIIGKDEEITLLLTAVICRGHVLMEDVPGTGKTVMAKSLAKSIDCSFSRIQFTPDLLPGDVTGMSVYDARTAEFVFRPGPVFTNILLADEINRATPKSQSALLEAMQEHTVTVDGKDYRMEEPFFVLATQNPIEQEGTYALPEAQVDRFMFKLLMRYPTVEEMKQIVMMTQKTMDEVADGVVDGETLLRMRETAKEIPVTDDIINYTMRLVSSTQPSSPEAGETAARMIRLGASPRAAQALITCAKVRAMVSGRFNVSHEDIDALACPVLRHRVKLSYEAMAERVTPDEVIAKLVDDMKKKRR